MTTEELTNQRARQFTSTSVVTTLTLPKFTDRRTGAADQLVVVGRRRQHVHRARRRRHGLRGRRPCAAEPGQLDAAGHTAQCASTESDTVHRAVRGGWLHASGQPAEGAAAGAAGLAGHSQADAVEE